ncbi:efflux transporter outer membrane subunit [Steroidobacter flavus]|uniref:Efflux transporter outer membrane subunit n=1 Tax=Steroidobacter flavus TaxID=1842136 RepID=A0ABV8T2G6_9GAMM
MRIAVLIVCVVSCVACSVAPSYRRPSVEIPASFKEAPGWREAMPSDAVARGEWWQLFGDPVLSDLQRQVVLSNQNLAASKAAYDQSRALVRELRASLLPVIDLTASGTKVGSFGTGNPTVGNTGSVSTGGNQRYSVTIGTTWEPDLWGRIGDSVRQAGALAQASEADLANATLSAQGELALDYIQGRGLQAQEEVLTATIAAYERALTITTNRYNAGVAARSDVLQAETALRNARANVADLGRQRALLEHAIAVLVGVNPSNFVLPSGEWSRDVPEIPGVLPASLLERRPDIAAAERRVAAANSAIGIERSAYFPTLQLSGDAGYSSRAMSDLFESASSIWSLGLTGALTLLDFGARSARVDQARAAYEQTVAEYRQTVLTAFQQTEDQLAALRVLDVVTTERDAAAVAAKSAEKIAYNQYFAGQIGYADVIVAQTAALSSRQAEIQAVVDRQSAAVALIQAIGGHWQ